MPQFIDSYFLIDTREKDQIFKVVNTFVPEWEKTADDFPIPLYSEEPTRIFESVDELFTYLETHKNEVYSIYLKNLNEVDAIRYIMIFYTDDGKAIVGFSTPGRVVESETAISLYKTLKHFLNAEISCMTIEESPPDNSVEFELFCKERFVPDL
ncbi:hypothetical protein [Chitinophaga vietnamensis]|uniref:hypothetical protein n=1 Tax=Chitinophaga vietnamensis TaxID=2593957 RepID=UPI00117759DE|nr:hypothetical protein [Chitinophaga vietnamensis]